ncbi:MAG TPA: chromate transporter [Anaerolineales bacterium]|nr:chromate transporter [Anaerolineales bacterium]
MKVPLTDAAPSSSHLPSGFWIWLELFWIFLKTNLLTSSGPASVGLLYKYVVGNFMTEPEFVEAVGFSNFLPGSEALKLAMFIGFDAGGYPGTAAALLGAILPPTVSMLVVMLVLQNFQNQPWVHGFIQGMVPAVAMLISVAAWKLFRGGKSIRTRPLVIAALSLIAFILGAPTPLVLLGSGLLGIFLFP